MRPPLRILLKLQAHRNIHMTPVNTSTSAMSFRHCVRQVKGSRMATEQACSMAVLAIGLYWAQLTCAGTCRHVQVRAALHREMAVGGSCTCPATGTVLVAPVTLTPNVALRKSIEVWAEKHAKWLLVRCPDVLYNRQQPITHLVHPGLAHHPVVPLCALNLQAILMLAQLNADFSSSSIGLG